MRPVLGTAAPWISPLACGETLLSFGPLAFLRASSMTEIEAKKAWTTKTRLAIGKHDQGGERRESMSRSRGRGGPNKGGGLRTFLTASAQLGLFRIC
jgi:hypothetical protein